MSSSSKSSPLSPSVSEGCNRGDCSLTPSRWTLSKEDFRGVCGALSASVAASGLMWSDLDGCSFVSLPSLGDLPLRGVEPSDFPIVCSDIDCGEDKVSVVLCGEECMNVLVHETCSQQLEKRLATGGYDVAAMGIWGLLCIGIVK